AGTEEAPEDPFAGWQQAARREGDLAWALYVETDPAPGVPAFRIETRFEVPPAIAARTLMASMSEGDATARGERRVLLEQTAETALVHTFVDLPFLFSDRELAVRIVASHDAATGIHRIDWVDENEHLPPPADGVLRLRTEGYWEFRPRAPFGSFATYVSRAEVGGSLPAGLRDRLMRDQAEDAVERLAHRIGTRDPATVAAPPPEGLVPRTGVE
ncbi:unnamed protein product, partial [Discosporangium mesarthrocarpum]